jgi:ribosomal protein S4
MRLDEILVTILSTSYTNARKLISRGHVRIGKRREDRPWFVLRSGHYFLHIQKIGVYKFAVSGGKVCKFKEVEKCS